MIGVGILKENNVESMEEMSNFRSNFEGVNKMRVGKYYEVDLKREDFMLIIDTFPITKIFIYLGGNKDDFLSLNFEELLLLYSYIDGLETQDLENLILNDIHFLFPDLFSDIERIIQ